MWRLRELLATLADFVKFGDFWGHLDAWAGVMSRRIRQEDRL